MKNCPIIWGYFVSCAELVSFRLYIVVICQLCDRTFVECDVGKLSCRYAAPFLCICLFALKKRSLLFCTFLCLEHCCIALFIAVDVEKPFEVQTRPECVYVKTRAQRTARFRCLFHVQKSAQKLAQMNARSWGSQGTLLWLPDLYRRETDTGPIFWKDDKIGIAGWLQREKLNLSCQYCFSKQKGNCWEKVCFHKKKSPILSDNLACYKRQRIKVDCVMRNEMRPSGQCSLLDTMTSSENNCLGVLFGHRKT